MTTRTFDGIGRVWLPERSLSLPGRAVEPKRVGIVIAIQKRPKWSMDGLFKLPHIEHPGPDPKAVIDELLKPFRELARLGEIRPDAFIAEAIWASITHNERVDDGAAHNVNRILGTVGSSNAVANIVAVANGTLTKTATDSSLGANAADLTTNEFTTIGLSRAAGTVQNYVAPASLNAVYSADVVKTFTASGSGTAYGSGLLDQVVVAGSKLFVEDNFGSTAVLVSGDTLAVTWTISA